MQRPTPELDLLAELAMLGSIAAAAGRARRSAEVAASALDIVLRRTSADAGVILYDDGTGLEVEAEVGFPRGAVARLVAARSVSDALSAALGARGDEPLVAPLAEVPMRDDIRAGLQANGLSWLLVAPLRAGGHLVGLFGLGWHAQPNQLPQGEALLNATTVIGTSLENVHLVEALQRTLASERRLADEEAALQSLTLIAETAGAFDELAATTIRQVVTLFGAAAGSYALITDDDRVVHSASVGIDRSFIRAAIDMPASEMISVQRLLDGFGPYLRRYEPGAVQQETLDMASERNWTAFAMLPITVRDRVRGLMALFFEAPPDVPDVDRTLAVVSRIASISLANFRLRERLQASETRYRVLFEESPDAIVLFSMTSEVLDANPAALRLYHTDLPGLRAFAKVAPRPSEAAHNLRRVALATEGRGTFRDLGHRPDGSTFPEEISIVRVSIGNEDRYLVIVRDMSEQDRIQQELLAAQKMEAIGQLVSGVAHELNNPLAAIVAFSQLLRRDERLPEDLRRDAELLVQEADRTRRIVRGLLDFARQRPPERHPTTLSALVESVLALQSYSLSAGQIELEVDVPPDLPLIDVDRSQLQQVLLNLSLNAIQAIRTTGRPGRIWLGARRVGSGEAAVVRLTVSDDGPGIPEDVRSRLFLPFFTTKAPGEGTGLGLSVSFGIAQSHGGSLRFEPRPGGGATFVLELPVGAGTDGAAGLGPTTEPTREPAREPAPMSPTRADAATAGQAMAPVGPTAPPITPTSSPTATPRVLVLDDEPAIRAFLTKSLRLADLDAIAVSRGEEAVEHCRSESFAAILVDHRMPGMSGTEVFDACVRIRPELASRFVFMSGDVLNPELRAFAAAHGAQLLAKPFDVDTVNHVVRDVVARTSGAEDATQRG